MPNARRLFTIGIVIIAVAIILLFLVSPYVLQYTFSNSIREAQRQINSTVYLLLPNQSLSIEISSGKILVYNATNPLKLLLNNQTLAQAGYNGTWIAPSTTNGTISLINNYTNQLKIGYAVVGIILWPSYLSIILGFLLGLVGIVVIAYATLVSLRNRAKQK
ncbi:hypothetical protein Calag_0844 [Caldisphaera lagunensis DSM 15908]|uniref:Uncharacterized protein n=1 Tax=Caldisphaera lagunensis (strain DSM 15908 / JCM 11604 / ANMR 0165 / IC-154) TaxID=1056495 RepID=L0AC13_CALLD|nr:hypothetical protein [Caldisphaera lagunensis]AFZ70585.1 hypothetical protein Calag_0844 [Caldisphaera lagunensis DSM 15908]